MKTGNMSLMEESIRTLKGVTGLLSAMADRDTAIESEELPYAFDLLTDAVRSVYKNLEELF